MLQLDKSNNNVDEEGCDAEVQLEEENFRSAAHFNKDEAQIICSNLEEKLWEGCKAIDKHQEREKLNVGLYLHHYNRLLYDTLQEKALAAYQKLVLNERECRLELHKDTVLYKAAYPSHPTEHSLSLSGSHL